MAKLAHQFLPEDTSSPTIRSHARVNSCCTLRRAPSVPWTPYVAPSRGRGSIVVVFHIDCGSPFPLSPTSPWLIPLWPGQDGGVISLVALTYLASGHIVASVKQGCGHDWELDWILESNEVQGVHSRKGIVLLSFRVHDAGRNYWIILYSKRCYFIFGLIVLG